MSKVILRKANINVRNKLSLYDQEGQEIVEEIRSNVVLIAKAKADLERLKNDLKMYESAKEEAEQALADGKESLTVCTLHIDFDRNTVRCQRDDTKEWLSERNVSEDDRQAETGDEEVEE